MLKLNWLTIVIVAVLAILTILLWKSDACLDTSYHGIPRQTAAASQQKSAPCADAELTSLQRLACALEAINTRQDSQEETQRAQSDLDAQWKMAYWARCMFAATVAQTILGLLGLIAIWRTLYWTKEAAAAVAEQTNQLRKEFVATHRPKLVVRQALALITDPLGTTISVQYTITNIGDSEAWITNSHIGIQFIKQIGYPLFRLPPEREFPDNAAHIGKIAPGQTVNCLYVDPSHRWDVDHRSEWIGEFGVYFVGHITYLDAPGSGIKRQLAFRRKYDINSQRFVRIKDAPVEDEYAD